MTNFRMCVQTFCYFCTTTKTQVVLCRLVPALFLSYNELLDKIVNFYILAAFMSLLWGE